MRVMKVKNLFQVVNECAENVSRTDFGPSRAYAFWREYFYTIQFRASNIEFAKVACIWRNSCRWIYSLCVCVLESKGFRLQWEKKRVVWCAHVETVTQYQMNRMISNFISPASFHRLPIEQNQIDWGFLAIHFSLVAIEMWRVECARAAYMIRGRIERLRFGCTFLISIR